MDLSEQAENIKRISGVDTKKCLRCGKCTASCPNYEDMEYHPHQFVYFIENGYLDRLLKSDAAFRCMTCFACVERCPRDVKPAKLIEAVRLTLVRQKDSNRLKPYDIIENLNADLPQQAIVSAMRKYTK
ncbi:MAG: 4Fe-4S dicluster domain-containing protein [Clostridia bacterium]|nr:4Fe-4S dicluster domain-containing protein [Clostridia bacterium]